MLTKDFLKLSSAISPNESFAKTLINSIFSTKMAIKKGNVLCKINSGINNDENEVAKIHENIIFLRFAGFMD